MLWRLLTIRSLDVTRNGPTLLSAWHSILKQNLRQQDTFGWRRGMSLRRDHRYVWWKKQTATLPASVESYRKYGNLSDINIFIVISIILVAGVVRSRKKVSKAIFFPEGEPGSYVRRSCSLIQTMTLLHCRTSVLGNAPLKRISWFRQEHLMQLPLSGM